MIIKALHFITHNVRSVKQSNIQCNYLITCNWSCIFFLLLILIFTLWAYSLYVQFSLILAFLWKYSLLFVFHSKTDCTHNHRLLVLLAQKLCKKDKKWLFGHCFQISTKINVNTSGLTFNKKSKKMTNCLHSKRKTTCQFPVERKENCTGFVQNVIECRRFLLLGLQWRLQQ